MRQSTQSQVQQNLKGQRRQYDLVQEARRRGFTDIEVIDDDLGRSASAMVARPGFERLVAGLCASAVGALPNNGRQPGNTLSSILMSAAGRSKCWAPVNYALAPDITSRTSRLSTTPCLHSAGLLNRKAMTAATACGEDAIWRGGTSGIGAERTQDCRASSAAP